MLQIKKSLLAVVAFAATLSAPNAFALPGFSLGVMGGASMSAPKVSDPTQWAGSTISGGTGLSAGASLGLGRLEVSALYSQMKTKYASGGGPSSLTENYLEIPVLLRMGVGPIGLGLGGFYSMFLSSIGGDINDSGSPNYGATASVRLTIPVIDIFVDGRYNLGLKEDGGVKISTLGAYVGFNFL
jgi:hypothetical protein